MGAEHENVPDDGSVWTNLRMDGTKVVARVALRGSASDSASASQERVQGLAVAADPT